MGTAASLFCSSYPSQLQQKAPNTNFSHLVRQNSILKKPQRFGTSISYPKPADKDAYSLTVLGFADARKACKRGQLEALLGLLIGWTKSCCYLPGDILDVPQLKKTCESRTGCWDFGSFRRHWESKNYCTRVPTASCRLNQCSAMCRFSRPTYFSFDSNKLSW